MSESKIIQIKMNYQDHYMHINFINCYSLYVPFIIQNITAVLNKDYIIKQHTLHSINLYKCKFSLFQQPFYLYYRNNSNKRKVFKYKLLCQNTMPNNARFMLKHLFVLKFIFRKYLILLYKIFCNIVFVFIICFLLKLNG